MSQLPQERPVSDTQSFRRDEAFKPAMRDGMAFAAMVGLGESFLGPFGIFLHGSILQIGILGTLPQMVGALGQALGVWFIERFPKRRDTLVKGALVNSLIWFPMAIVPLLFDSSSAATYALIVCAAIYFASGGLMSPVWSSLIGDLVPGRIRGRFFGYRNRWLGMCTFGGLVVAGQILDITQSLKVPSLGFVIIFIMAGCFRLLSREYLKQYADPPYIIKPEQRFTFWQFLKRSPWSNFAKFVFFSATINLGAAFAAPYFAVYMLRDLNLSYGEFTFLSAIQTVTQFVLMQYWGGLTDRFGNRKIMKLCAYGLCVSPILWLFSTELAFLALVQLYSGFVWAGYNLATTNFIFDAVTPAKLPRCAAYHASVNATFFVIGSLAGGYCATHMDGILSFLGIAFRPSSDLLIVFAISGLLRSLAVFTLLPRFREVREVEPIRTKQLFFMVANVRPIAGATFDVVMDRVGKRLKRKRKPPTPK